MTGQSPTTFEVRQMAPAEAEALGRLTVAAYTGLPGFAPGDAYLAELADVAGRAARGAVVLVAVDAGGHLLGGVTYVPGPGGGAGPAGQGSRAAREARDRPLAEFDDPAHAGIRMLAVAPEARRRGVGTFLVRACIARARAEGRTRLWLHTTEAMRGARRLYERESFHRAPEADCLGPLHLLAYVLELEGLPVGTEGIEPSLGAV
ncbi:MAG: GNAT family N-acetyltransferase [Acidimicrobiales bacterium]